MGGFSFSGFYSFFPQARVAAALQDEENRAVEVSDRLVQSNLSPIEIITLDDSTDAPTLQPPSSPLNVRHQPLKATNQTPIATSPTENRLMEVEASEQTREQSISHKFGWNISATNRAPWPLPGSSNSRVQVPTAPAMSPTIESLVREVMTYCDTSTIYDASTSTIYHTTTAPYRTIDEPSTSLHSYPPTWSNKPYSSYQRGHDWAHQKTHSEEERPPQAYPTQFNPIQANQRNLENQPQKPFTEQNRPSVIRSVKNKLPVLNIDPVLIKENRSKTYGPSYGTDSNEVIMKYIHKKFSRKTQYLDRPSTSLLMEFDETFKHEESSQDMDTMRSSTALGDLELEGHSNIQTIFHTYLAEDAPYMEERKGVFVNAWNEINLGEKLVANWIAFTRDAVPLPRDFHVKAQGQMK